MTSKGSFGAKNTSSKVRIKRAPHSWAVSAQLKETRFFGMPRAGGAAPSLQRLVPGKPANLPLFCHLTCQSTSPSAFVLSSHGSCPIAPMFSGCPLCLFWLFHRLLGCVWCYGDGRVGAWRSCKHYAAQDHTTDLCRDIMMFSVFSFFFLLFFFLLS